MTFKQLRTKAGLTQQELATQIGATKQYVSDLERGVRDINGVKASTVAAMATTLKVTVDEVLASQRAEGFDFEDGKLVIDRAYYSHHYQYDIVLEINGLYYLLNPMQIKLDDKIDTKKLRPYKASKPSNDNDITDDISYLHINGLIPRSGYTVELGDAISNKRLDKLKDDYQIGKDDITEPFEDAIGKIYGDKYQKSFTCVQVKVCNSESIKLERELRKEGIQANCISPSRVNVRIK